MQGADFIINNELYNASGDIWRDPGSPFYLMKSSFNPARMSYFRRILLTELKANPRGKTALEVGCGGGILCEEIARMGFDVTGVDPSAPSLKAAAASAKANCLKIKYIKGKGEALPFGDNSFDAVFCCDVLEHVSDLAKVISEISRVLKPGGCFFYDTINRTLLSKLAAIKISQEWKRWAYAPPGIHSFDMFIKPKEIKALLKKNNLIFAEHSGLWLKSSASGILRLLRKRAEGELSYKELGDRLKLRESRIKSVLYMGYAVKNKIREP